MGFGLFAFLGSLALAGGVSTTKVTVESDGSVAKGSAACKAGREVVSGGFHARGGSPYLLSSYPAGGNGWRSALRVFGPSGQESDLYAYCSRAHTSIRNASRETDSHVQSVTAHCRKGKVALGGGPSGGNGDSAYPFVSRRAGKRGWTAKYSVFDPATIGVKVVCAGGRAPTVAKKTIAAGGAPDRYTATAACKGDQRVISGGFATDVPFDDGASFFNGSRKIGKQKWQVKMTTQIESKLTAYAYCDG